MPGRLASRRELGAAPPRPSESESCGEEAFPGKHVGLPLRLPAKGRPRRRAALGAALAAGPQPGSPQPPAGRGRHFAEGLAARGRSPHRQPPCGAKEGWVLQAPSLSAGVPALCLGCLFGLSPHTPCSQLAHHSRARRIQKKCIFNHFFSISTHHSNGLSFKKSRWLQLVRIFSPWSQRVGKHHLWKAGSTDHQPLASTKPASRGSGQGGGRWKVAISSGDTWKSQ